MGRSERAILDLIVLWGVLHMAQGHLNPNNDTAMVKSHLLQWNNSGVTGALGEDRVFDPSTVTGINNLTNYIAVDNIEECCPSCQTINQDTRFYVFSSSSFHCACLSPIDGVRPATTDPANLQGWMPQPVAEVCDKRGDIATDLHFVKMDALDLGNDYEDVSDEPMDDGISLEDCQVGNGKDYSGRKNTSKSGLICQDWRSQVPHPHRKYQMEDGAQDNNYCRNPDGDTGVWCFTMDKNVRWEHCGVPVCDKKGDDVVTNLMQMDVLDLGSGYEDVSDEPMDDGISLGVEEILLEAQLEQLEKENANLKAKIQMMDTQLRNMQKVEKFCEHEKIIGFEQLQEDLLSSQNKGNSLQSKLTMTTRNLKNITTHAKHLKSQLDTELELKSTYQEEAQLERQLHGITKQELEDSRNLIKVSMNFTKLLVGHISKLENMTDPVDMKSTIYQMKEKETLYLAENLAYQNEILLLRNLTSKERDQNENLIYSMTQQGKLEKLKERMINILQSSLMEMARAIPNCTTITTQELEDHLDTVLVEQDPLKQLISECSIFNETSANLQTLYVQHNTQLKEQLATKMNVINHHIEENRELNDALEETKQLANVQSQSLKLLASEMDRLLPNGITRFQRNADGQIESVYLCQCIPEAPKASQLKISAIQWTCPEDKAVDHENTFSHTCSDDSDCSVGAWSWPQCEDVYAKSWSSWQYLDCTEVDVGNETFLCGNGHRSRSRQVRSWINNSWISEDVSEQCVPCSLSAASPRAVALRYAVAISPPALETALKTAMDVAEKKVCETHDGWVQFPRLAGCYKRFGSSRSWQSARSYCQSLDSELASIHSYEENNAVKHMITGDAWIGFNDKRSTYTYEWSDGTPNEYSNWEGGQPSGSSEHATVIDTNGKWWDRTEDSNYQFVCKF